MNTITEPVECSLSPLVPVRKAGTERFQTNAEILQFSLLDFWQWSVSDLISNVTRGRLAEFIVAKALGISTDGVRDEWQAFDLLTNEGLKIEVKSAAYVQSWFQKALSRITFKVKKSLAWDRDSNLQSKESKRQADAYIFAVLAHKDKLTVNPLNLDQWEFWVLSTKALNERKRSQHSITIRSLEKLCGHPVRFRELGSIVANVAHRCIQR